MVAQRGHSHSYLTNGQSWNSDTRWQKHNSHTAAYAIRYIRMNLFTIDPEDPIIGVLRVILGGGPKMHMFDSPAPIKHTSYRDIQLICQTH